VQIQDCTNHGPRVELPDVVQIQDCTNHGPRVELPDVVQIQDCTNHGPRLSGGATIVRTKYWKKSFSTEVVDQFQSNLVKIIFA
jgi:hypothetical protein